MHRPVRWTFKPGIEAGFRFAAPDRPICARGVGCGNRTKVRSVRKVAPRTYRDATETAAVKLGEQFVRWGTPARNARRERPARAACLSSQPEGFGNRRVRNKPRGAARPRPAAPAGPAGRCAAEPGARLAGTAPTGPLPPQPAPRSAKAASLAISSSPARPARPD